MDAVNFADPNFEPTDEHFARLTREAFARVAEDRRRALERLREEIERERKRVLARLRP